MISDRPLSLFELKKKKVQIKVMLVFFKSPDQSGRSSGGVQVKQTSSSISHEIVVMLSRLQCAGSYLALRTCQDLKFTGGC